MQIVELIQREAKTLKFVITDNYGNPVDVTSVTAHLYVKTNLSDMTYLFEKSDPNFNKENAAAGVLKVNLTSSDLDFAGEAYGILKITFSSTNIDKYIFKIVLTESSE